MTTKVQSKLSITPEYLEKAITCALSKSGSLNRMFLRVKTVNPSVCHMADRAYFRLPDFAGCYFDFMEFDVVLAKHFLSVNPKYLLTYYSFHFVWDICDSNQNAVMQATEVDSKWANEGYIVTTRLPTAPDERKALQDSFEESGSGLIKIDPQDYKKSEIICLAGSQQVKIPLDLEQAYLDNEGFQELQEEVDFRLSTCKRSVGRISLVKNTVWQQPLRFCLDFSVLFM